MTTVRLVVDGYTIRRPGPLPTLPWAIYDQQGILVRNEKRWWEVKQWLAAKRVAQLPGARSA